MNAKPFGVALLLPLLVGCGAEPETHPVGGRVAFDGGAAVNVGLVEFVPLAGGPSARGRIEPGGRYVLSTYGEDDGARTGEYVVLVSQPQLVVGSLRPAPEGHNDDHHGGEEFLATVPADYARRNASPLRATVEPGENRIDLTLSADGP